MNPPALSTVAHRLGSLVRNHGLAPGVRPASLEELLQAERALALPPAWVEMYRVFSPEGFALPAAGNDQALYGAAELARAQEGYGGPGWSPHWLVISGEGEFPLVVDTSASGDNGVHLVALHASGQGKRSTLTWVPRRLSDSTAGFLQGVCVYLETMPQGEGAVWRLPQEVRQDWYARVLAAWRENAELREHLDAWRDWLGVEATFQ